MKIKVKVSFAECLMALVTCIFLTVIGIAISLVLNWIFPTVGGFLAGLRWVGIIFQIIGDFIEDTFLNSIIALFLYGIVGLMAGQACWMVFKHRVAGQNFKMKFTIFLCGLIALAGTFLAKLLFIAIQIDWNAVRTMQWEVWLTSSWNIFMDHSSAYVTSKFADTFISVFQIGITIFNALAGFGIGLRLLTIDLDDA